MTLMSKRTNEQTNKNTGPSFRPVHLAQQNSVCFSGEGLCPGQSVGQVQRSGVWCAAQAGSR